MMTFFFSFFWFLIFQRVWCVPSEFPEFRILKHLDFSVLALDENSLLSCISLIKACPLLHKLGVQVSVLLPGSLVTESLGFYYTLVKYCFLFLLRSKC